MSGSKAPGPDSMSTKFFQHYWDIVGSDHTNMVLNNFINGVLLRKYNLTLITLIPKVVKPVNMSQFRPIVLCNVVAKVIAKMMATRLECVLPLVISKSQSFFVPDRLIMDNVFLAYELHHFLKNQKTGGRGFMSIKLDMLKAYDQIEWSFLKEMLHLIRFSYKWINLIMDYVEYVSYTVMINGEQSDFQTWKLPKAGRSLFTLSFYHFYGRVDIFTQQCMWERGITRYPFGAKF
ncbi:hypothetical protein LIER_33940 [Lithospermum erythrorhizon]|uniref:Reverse transcriptase domain-containing protein n=1 Tax=Lithospermum erythrorhizon TaxID=34254 RepID=A0AAV3RZK8_LITER